MSDSRILNRKQIEKTVQNQQEKKIKREYQVIPYQKRLKLIDYVVNQGYAISKASKLLGVKPSTGKVIISSYRKNGHITKRKEQKMDLNIQKPQESSMPNQMLNASGYTQFYPICYPTYPEFYYNSFY